MGAWPSPTPRPPPRPAHLAPAADRPPVPLPTWADPTQAAVLPKDDGCGALDDVILREAARRLSVLATGTALCVQNRARLVRALYTRLDRLTEPLPATT
ncbi:hypothetical protein [Streptomyces cinereoruber]|uniref:hypothetical protein n=1 Tax=Streptomyces cinereoruber TaxID=67260 RepID=UPI003C2EF757